MHEIETVKQSRLLTEATLDILGEEGRSQDVG
jgi:hypothetical protein